MLKASNPCVGALGLFLGKISQLLIVYSEWQIAIKIFHKLLSIWRNEIDSPFAQYKNSPDVCDSHYCSEGRAVLEKWLDFLVNVEERQNNRLISHNACTNLIEAANISIWAEFLSSEHTMFSGISLAQFVARRQTIPEQIFGVITSGITDFY